MRNERPGFLYLLEQVVMSEFNLKPGLHEQPNDPS